MAAPPPPAPAPTAPPAPVRLRAAVVEDLDALERLESVFPGDRLSRSALRRLLTRAHADAWVAVGKARAEPAGRPPDDRDGGRPPEGGGGGSGAEDAGADERVLGAAYVLYRRGFRSARLYSLAVAPEARGRGVASALLARCEEAAREAGCAWLRLEVREDNAAAIALYRARGFEEGGRTADYYEDGSSAVRMRRRLDAPSGPDVPAEGRGGAPRLLDLPYHPQSLDFTCGAASLLMALRHLGVASEMTEGIELDLWREATTIFMLSGHGGCSAHGLAVAALRRGVRVEVVVRDADAPFVDTVRRPDKKRVVEATHARFVQEIERLGGTVTIRDFTDREVVEALSAGAVPLLLVSGYRLYAEKIPHWVVVSGWDEEHLYLHDPFIPEGTERADSVHLALARKDFARVSTYGRARHRQMVLLHADGEGGGGA